MRTDNIPKPRAARTAAVKLAALSVLMTATLSSAPLIAHAQSMPGYYLVVPVANEVSPKRTMKPVIEMSMADYELPNGQVNTPYSFDLSALLSVIGDYDYDASLISWSISPPLPDGLLIDVNGRISGSRPVSHQALHEVSATYKEESISRTYDLLIHTASLHENGVTVQCQGMPAGQEFTLPETGSKKWRVVYSKADAKTYAETACTSNMSDMSHMAFGAEFNTDISHWDTSNVTNMAQIFRGADLFNQPVGEWNTGQVVNMANMFYGASAFNQPIGEWDVASVNNMSSMFYGASAFNQSIGGWDTGSVKSMAGMFHGSISFNQPIEGWDTSSVTAMNAMFYGASAFNQPIGEWDTSSVTNMALMFVHARNFDQPIGGWDTTSVTNMSGMFTAAHSFNHPIDDWNVSNVTVMAQMFGDAFSFNHPLGNWDVSNVTNMSFMFNHAYRFNQNIGRWDVSNVTNMAGMFNAAHAFNQPLCEWSVSHFIDVPVGFKSSLTDANAPKFPGTTWGSACD